MESQEELQGLHDKTYNLIYIFNQLMTHQCILNMSFAQNISTGKDVLNKSIEVVLNIFKFYVNHFRLQIDTGEVFDLQDYKNAAVQQNPVRVAPRVKYSE